MSGAEKQAKLGALEHRATLANYSGSVEKVELGAGWYLLQASGGEVPFENSLDIGFNTTQATVVQAEQDLTVYFKDTGVVALMRSGAKLVISKYNFVEGM